MFGWRRRRRGRGRGSRAASRAHGADHDLLAHHIGRRAVDAQQLGEAHVLGQHLLHLRRLHVALQARHVGADLAGDLEGAGAIGLAAAAEQLLVEFEVLGRGNLHLQRYGDIGASMEPGPSTGKSLRTTRRRESERSSSIISGSARLQKPQL